MTLGEKHLEFWSSRLRRPSFVYIIQGDPHTPVKVGLAKDPLKRLASLQTGNPQRLRLLRVVPGDRQLEASWHKRLRNSLVYGEWFEGPEVNALVEFVTTLGQVVIRCRSVKNCCHDVLSRLLSGPALPFALHTMQCNMAPPNARVMRLSGRTGSRSARTPQLEKRRQARGALIPRWRPVEWLTG